MFMVVDDDDDDKDEDVRYYLTPFMGRRSRKESSGEIISLFLGFIIVGCFSAKIFLALGNRRNRWRWEERVNLNPKSFVLIQRESVCTVLAD